MSAYRRSTGGLPAVYPRSTVADARHGRPPSTATLLHYRRNKSLEGQQYITCEYVTSQDACNPARRQSGSAYLVCDRTDGSESGHQAVQNTRQLHARARVRRASPGSMATKCSTIDRAQPPRLRACGIFRSPEKVDGRRPSSTGVYDHLLPRAS